MRVALDVLISYEGGDVCVRELRDEIPRIGDTTFTHLTAYSSNVYTYLLDKVIAVDFFSQFDKSNVLGGPAAMRYRRTVLEPGGTKPAEELVRDFLGRPQNMDALKSWMGEEFKTIASGSAQGGR